MPEQAGDELYGVDPAAFVATRDALVKRLRAAGDRAEADRVSRLRRPTVTAWALNQVARHQPGLIAAVLDAGASLRRAMEHAVAGEVSGLREAQLGSRRATDTAVEAAAGYLPDGADAAGAGARLKMAATLRSAVVDDEVSGRLRAGVLQQDQETPGFGLDADSLTTMAATPRSGRTRDVAQAKAGTPQHDKPDAGQQAPGRRVSQDARLERLAHRAERLRADAAEAQRRAALAATSADEAQRQAAFAATAAAKAERQATLAATAAEKAAGVAAAAEQALLRAHEDRPT